MTGEAESADEATPDDQTVALVPGTPGSERAAIERLLDLLGSPLDAVKPGDRVLIKPNVFDPRPGFLTSPRLIAALAAAVVDRGAHVTVGERTGQIHQALAGTDVGRYATIVSFDDQPLRLVRIAGARSLRVPVPVPEIVLDCDHFFGTPHLRTHATMVLTGAMKNLVGLLPGAVPRLVHLAGVAESVVDLNLMRPQGLVVVDAMTVVEGNYPVAGSVRPVGLIVAGTDPVAVDLVLAKLAGVEPCELPFLVEAARRGLSPRRVMVRGEPLATAGFRILRSPRIPQPHDRVHLHLDTACEPCQRWVATALAELAADLARYPGELTIVAGPRERLPPARGPMVLVGNALYGHRDAGIYVEGCPPRAIQVAALRYAIGHSVSTEELGQFRVPDDVHALAGIDPGQVATLVDLTGE